ncbi:MAG TPA: zf-HC2 domain-containing protein [Microlunatus sp.]|nr:zf-HC2 domain-containing protein [Microlunatus sp.]
MKAHSCAELAELRSAYVDGALDDADRERLLTHLVDCTDCRRDVAELRHVRALLTGSTDPGLTPDDLSHRLVSIAGDEATEPLWTRPFRRTPAAGQLPSQRHQVRIRVLAGVLGCGLALLTGLGIGYVSAPSDSALTALDPTNQAITEFTAVVSAFPLDGRVSVALQGQQPTGSTGGGSPTGVSLPAKALSEAKAVKLLTQAGQAGDQLPYTATQVVDLQRDDQRIHNTVQVSSSGAGTRLSPGGSGTATVSTHSYVETDSSTRMADADLIERLAHRYTLRGWKSQSYGDRTAYVVEAVEPTATPADGDLSGVAARWWIDSRSKLLFGQETYDGRGNLVISSWLTDLRFGAAADVNGPDSRTGPAGQPPRTTATLTLSRAGQLRRNGWICAERLAGLPLLRLRTDQTGDPDLVHLIYSDGLTTVSVVEQRGRLHGAPTGTIRNETLGAWVTEQMPATATWTSGDIVLTAVTDGSRETLAAAVAALPHDGRQRPTTMERVRAGWSRILGR